MPRFALYLISALGLVVAAGAAAPLISARADTAAPPELVAEGARADRILIEKADRRITLFRGEEALAIYSIALGFAPEGPKTREGDGRTPEGVYRIDRRNARSAYHLSLGLNYPREDQTQVALAQGVDPGGDIFIHGQPNGFPPGLTLFGDWTAGCIAVSNEAMREIWAMVDYGVVVEIKA